jgi:serine phosphatase RsbU (regulator of sigma subunit)
MEAGTTRAPAEEITRRVADQIDQFSGGNLSDDRTLLVVQRLTGSDWRSGA